MLTDEQCDQLDRLAMGAVIAITSVLGLFAVPEAALSIKDTLKGHKPLFGFGSRLADKYGKALALELPHVVYEPEREPEREQRKLEAAALVASGFLGSAYEILKSHRVEEDSLWEFFRHSRNACFHGNRFHFKPGEPRRFACWRGLTITQGLQGSPLLFEFIQFADTFHMLSDLTVQIGMPQGEEPMFGVIDPEWTF